MHAVQQRRAIVTARGQFKPAQTGVCPVTRGPLHYDREKQELVSKSARLAYPIRDGVPIMLESEARELSDAEAKAK